MKIRLLHALCVLASGGLALENAPAADEIAPLPGLDTCIAAALQQRPGMLFGWRSLNDPPDGSHRITFITPHGRSQTPSARPMRRPTCASRIAPACTASSTTSG